jgi:dCTP deaminase
VLLSDLELNAEIAAGRLAFEPPILRGAIQSASIDLSLSNRFWKPRLPEGDGITVQVDIAKAQAYQYFEALTADEIVLKPQEMLLGETAEGVTIPQHLVGWIEGKSGRARHGLLVHCTAPHIAPGWGRPIPKPITLELVNLGPAEIVLRAGIAIAQLLVTRVGLPSTVLYSGKHKDLGSDPS